MADREIEIISVDVGEISDRAIEMGALTRDGLISAFKTMGNQVDSQGNPIVVRRGGVEDAGD